ncbi:DUF3515 domain-containing protein [Haloactinopolyspora sp.]|uniref:DUF3515 domain-containing protein n=1 Tax=Haloactinopolyspora sp. TaxID=1966353 RepID=UPI003420E766
MALSSCGFGAVDVEPHEVQPGSADTCSDLLAELPDTLDNAVRRDVDPPVATIAAWGNPPIVLRCGVAMPAAYRPDAQLHDIDGVGWFVEPGDGGQFFTAADRAVLVEVAIPDDYAPEADVLMDLAPAILATVPAR